ncbi:hypothetical protein [Chryseobacterium vrystaatense]|nr:hypothetical protein [Chryseobacterium vrystaatense]
MIPTEDFENGISVENIISQLNTESIFDFEYTPQERDTLDIIFNAKNRTEYKYFTIIFRDQIWQEGRNPIFTSISKEIAAGEIKITYKEENIFLKHCENLKSKYGIEIPESIKVRCSNLKNDSQDPVYLAIKDFKEYKIFYTSEFMKYIAKKYFRIYPDTENSDRLQLMVDEAQNSFSLTEKKFVSKEANLSFINQCFNDLNKDLDECLSIAIPVQNDQYLIVEGRLSGRTVFKSKKDNRYFKNISQKLKYEGFELS